MSKSITISQGDEMIALYADTINGVSMRGDDDLVTEQLDQQTFFESLADLCDGDYITAIVDPIMATKIDSIYGINN